MIKKIYFSFFLFFILICIESFPQSLRKSQDIYSDIINSVSRDSLIESVKDLSGFQPIILNNSMITLVTRHSDRFHKGNDYARQYIQQRLLSYGLQSTIQPFDPDYDGKNVIAEMPGYQYPDQKYIICAHYDDEPYNDEYAPGADDNATGVAIVLEAARILHEYKFPYTVSFIFFDQEEHDKRGSKYYASNARAAGDSILGVINVDMVGYDSDSNNVADIHTKNIGISRLIGNKLVAINNNYNIGLNFLYYAFGATASDHESFWINGYSAIWLDEDRDNDKNPHYHTSSDSVQYINQVYFTKIAKVAIASLAAVGSEVLPVELTFFTASCVKDKIILNWSTASEINNFGFEIQKSSDKSEWKQIAFIEGSGNSNSPKFYSFTDNNTNSAPLLKYRLKQIDIDGNFQYSNVVEVFTSNLVNGYRLEQNYPNPFNPSTTIRFVFENDTKAELSVYDILGNKIAELFNEQAAGGTIYNIKFNAENYSSGIYFYKLISSGKIEIKKMILLK